MRRIPRIGMKMVKPKKNTPPAFTLADNGEGKSTVRDDFWWVYKELGGRRALLEWSKENAREFFKIFFSFFPKEGAKDTPQAELVAALKEMAGDEDG